MKLNYFSKTVIGLVRKANEDSIGSIVKPNKYNLNLRIVCDGMGGHIGGAKASKIAVQSIQEYFTNNPNPVPQIALKEAIGFANIQIYGSAQAEPEFKGMGTTCTVLLEIEGLIYIAHVGDSRIYIHTDKKLYRITKDHSYVQELVDKGEITDQQMETHPKKNQLTRALGISDEVEVEVVSKPILAKTGDYFMLCSDGLNGLINDRMINSVLKTNVSIETMVNNLITMAESAGGHDNISVDLIEVFESEHIKTQFVNKNNEDLIDTKTQQFVIDKKTKPNTTLSFLKNKIIILPIIIGIIFCGYLINTNNPSTPEQILIEEKVEEIKPVSEIDTIKVEALEGWGTSLLNESFKNEVIKKVGDYCKDCPMFFRKGKVEPISIQTYRETIEDLMVGDYLMVTVTNNKIDMPEINKTNNKDEDSDNKFSDLKKQAEDKRKEEVERLAKKKADAEKRKAKEKDSIDKKQKNNSIKIGPVTIKRENRDSMKSDNKNKSRNRKKNIDNKINSKPNIVGEENDTISSKKK